MTPQEIEDLFVRSLDVPMTPAEHTLFMTALQKNSGVAERLSMHKKIRELLVRQTPASFGYYFSAKLVARIENSRIIIERQMFFFFKKYQLIAAGVIVALLVLNTIFSQQMSLASIFGLDNTATEEIVSFDFYNTLK